MDILRANDLLRSIKQLHEKKNYLEEMYKEILQTTELVTFVPYGHAFGFTVGVPVTTEGVAAAVSRELEVAKKQIEDLAEETGRALGI